MTVAELIVLLKEMPQDGKVYAEGCDCINPVNAVIEEVKTRRGMRSAF